MVRTPFLTGLHAPMTEELTIEDLAVTGSIPPALDGRYLRIGPNPIAADPRTYQWFLGDGMVHGLRIEGGRGALVSQSLGPLDRGHDRAESRARPGPRHGDFDTVNTNVIGFAGPD
jgi:hypothetical protein